MFLYLVPLSEWRNKMLYIGQALDTGPLVLCPGLFIAAKLRLNGAILFRASLHSARLTEADLIGANLTRAVLSGAIALTQEQLDAACGDAETKLDPGLAVPPC